MESGIRELEARGFIQQCSDMERLEEVMSSEKISLYVGVDPTARSLHIGHMVPFYAMAHLQQAGHRPILVVGGGTGLIGDPSGKTEMRKIISLEEIRENEKAIKWGASKLIDFSEGRAVMVGLMGGLKAELNLGSLLLRRGALKAMTMRAQPLEERIRHAQIFRHRLMPFFEDGSLKPDLAQTFPFEEVPAAHEAMARNEHLGRIVLRL